MPAYFTMTRPQSTAPSPSSVVRDRPYYCSGASSWRVVGCRPRQTSRPWFSPSTPLVLVQEICGMLYAC